MIVRKEIEIGGRTLSLETGRVARQASGSIWIQYGENGSAGCGYAIK